MANGEELEDGARQVSAQVRLHAELVGVKVETGFYRIGVVPSAQLTGHSLDAGGQARCGSAFAVSELAGNGLRYMHAAIVEKNAVFDCSDKLAMALGLASFQRLPSTCVKL
jgi:hypothetical protein